MNFSSSNFKIWRNFSLIIILFIIAFGFVGDRYYNLLADKLKEKTKISLPRLPEHPFHLGLDLVGGAHLTYQADLSKVEAIDKKSALNGVRDVIERRVNVFGVSEPLVQTSQSGEDYRILVDLAGVKDVNKAIEMIGKTPILEFKEENTGETAIGEKEQKEAEEKNKVIEIKAQETLGKLLSNGDFKQLAKEVSEDDKTKDNGGDLGWINAKDQPEIVKALEKAKKGELLNQIIKTNDGFEILKLEDTRVKSNPFNNQLEKEVKASHILICYKDKEACDKTISRDEAYAKIKEIQTKATPNNFKDLAKQYSDEPGADKTGGDLGWFGKGAMVEPFEKTVFDNQKVNTISYIVETKFGLHLIYKEAERDVMEYKVSHILFKKAGITLNAELSWKETGLTGKDLKRASVSFNPNDNSPEISLEFNDAGSDLFASITERNLNKQVAIFLDGYPLSAPRVNSKITGGKAVITGKFTLKEAKDLAQNLNAGSLPVPVKLIGQETVGPTLGQASVEASLKAGIIGLILVALFMVLYYRLAGILAVFALMLYGLLVLSIFKLWITLTLAGIAGFILSIGMAVDANVLIFERLKEELKNGKPFNLALEEGFKRAWPSIRDSNLSTLLTCVILIIFTTSLVKGFAITLSIGIIISMFSAVLVTKNLCQIASRSKKLVEMKWLWRG